MKRLLYIICVLVSVACSKDIFEEGYVPSGAGVSSQISPSAYVSSADMPPAATKALINTSTVASMEANALRIDENIENDMGLYEYEGWQEAYLLEATVSASPANDGLRSMYLNPVQAYKFRVVNNDTTDFYHTRMVSWYPRTAHLHKNSEGNAVITKFKDFKETIDESIYGTGAGDRVVLNFSGLDGSKDVMVSNIVEGQHWHRNTSGVGPGEDIYTYPFGDNPGGQKKYRNVMTYKHYMSAIKVYAYTENSEQDVSMWGALNKVMVKNQPSGVSVTLPSPADMQEASVENFVQNNALVYGEAAFSSELTDFPLIKTPMYGEGGADDQEVAPDSPHLEKNQEVYLGYALIRPNSLSSGDNRDSGQKLELEVHTDAGALTVEVDMTQTVEEVKQQYFQPGYIYTIRINFNTEGAIAGIVMRAGDDHYYDLSSGEEFDGEVHDHKYANCYIVHDGLKRDEEYYDGFAFTATTIGNGPTGLYSGFYPSSVEIDPVRAGLLWESESGLITQVELIYGYVRFKVKQDGDGYKKGNAVIAVYDSQRKVLWSWHIWVAGDDAPKDVSYTVNGNTIVLLDRNLGATDAGSGEASLLDTYGLYYQWGRKDPSMGPPESSYLPQSTATMNYYDYYGIIWNYAGVVTVGQPTLRDGVENPMYLIMPTDFSMTTYQYDWLYTNVDNLWGDYDHSAAESTSSRLKTIYDPCPFGYMVPQDEISTLFATKSPDMVDEGTGYTIQGTRGEDDSYDSFFPFAGYKGVDKGVSSLTGAWKYVGHKGDYMSSKIEGNGHRSRTYISDTSSWIEYGADSDNDGDGDASRTYQSNILADDMTNRRTAASVRCVKRTNALNASLVASFVGDRTYAFIDDGVITFNYDVKAYGSTIKSAKVDKDEVEVTPNPISYSSGSSQISGSFNLPVPKTLNSGIARYRLISETSSGVVSRVSYALRLFELKYVKVTVGGNEYAPGAQGLKCKYGETYPVSFTLKGIESDFSVYVNGVQAAKGNVETDGNGVATIPYTAQVYIPGHLNIQIRDAEGGLACHKSYEVAMSAITSYHKGDYVNNVKNLEAGALYMIKTYQGNTDYYLTYDSGTLILSPESTPSANNVFLFHRDDTKAGGVSANYRNVSAGAWRNLAADDATPGDHDDGFFTESFGFGTEAQAAYTTCANGWGSQTSQDIDLYLGSTGKFLYYIDDTLHWGTDGNYHSWKWVIYKVTVE